MHLFTCHHFIIIGKNAKDPFSVKQARKLEREYMKKWINQARANLNMELTGNILISRKKILINIFFCNFQTLALMTSSMMVKTTMLFESPDCKQIVRNSSQT